MGPKLPAILISFCSDDSDKPPHFSPPERDIHNKQATTSARVTASGDSSPRQEQRQKHNTSKSNETVCSHGDNHSTPAVVQSRAVFGKEPTAD